MIWESFVFIRDELNNYLSDKLDQSSPVVMGNIAQLNEGNGGGEGLGEKIILSLVNVEENRISKNPENFVKVGTQVVYKNPKIHLNIYCLFSVNKEYEEALKSLTHIIRFFQHHNVFNHQNSPLLDQGIEKLIFDLHTLGFEQMNQLWATLGGKYFPSVMYKMRAITIEEDFTEGEADLITKVQITGANFTQ